MDALAAANSVPLSTADSPEVTSSVTIAQNALRKRPRDRESSPPRWDDTPHRDKVRVVYREIGIKHAYDLEVILALLSSKPAPCYDRWSKEVSHEEISSILSDREATMERLSAALAERVELKAEIKRLQESKDDTLQQIHETVPLLSSEQTALQEQLEIVDDLAVEQELQFPNLPEHEDEQAGDAYSTRIAALEKSAPEGGDGLDDLRSHSRQITIQTAEMESAATSTKVKLTLTFGSNYQADDALLAPCKAMLCWFREDLEEAVESQKALEEELAQLRERAEILQSDLDQASLARDRSNAELQEARLTTQVLQTNNEAELEKLRRHLEGSQRSIAIVEADLSTERSLCKQLSAELESLEAASAAATQVTASELGNLNRRLTQLQQELDDEKLKKDEFLQDMGSLNAQIATLQLDLQKKEDNEKAFVERISALEHQTEMIQTLDALTDCAQALENQFLQRGGAVGCDFLRDSTTLLDKLAKSKSLHATLRSASFISKVALAHLQDENGKISTSLQEETARSEANLAAASARVSELEHHLQKEQVAVIDLHSRLSSEHGDFTKEIEELRASRGMLQAELAISRKNHEDSRNSHTLLQQTTTAEQLRLRQERNEASRSETEARALNTQLLVQVADLRKQCLNLDAVHASCQDTIDNYKGNVERLTAQQEDLRQEVANYRSSNESSAALQSELDEVKKQVAAILPLVKKATGRRNRQHPASSNQGVAGSNFDSPASPGQNAIGNSGSTKGKAPETPGVLIPMKQLGSKKLVPLTQRVLLSSRSQTTPGPVHGQITTAMVAVADTAARSFELPSPMPLSTRSEPQAPLFRSETTLTRRHIVDNWRQEQWASSVADGYFFPRPDGTPTQPSSPVLTTVVGMPIAPTSPFHSQGQSSFSLAREDLVDGSSNQIQLLSNNQSFLSSFQIHAQTPPAIVASASTANLSSVPLFTPAREASLYEDDFIVRSSNPRPTAQE